MTDVQTPKLPAPVALERDDIGRPVALRFDSPQPAAASRERPLLAMDGSPHALHALEEAIALARGLGDGAIDLVNVQPWLSKEAANEELAWRGWQATAQARARLDESGIAWRLHILMGEAANSIVTLARKLDSRLIVIGSHGHGATESLLLGSVAYKVIHLFHGSVLVTRLPAKTAP